MPFNGNVTVFEKVLQENICWLNYAPTALFDPWTPAALVSLPIHSFKNKRPDSLFVFFLLLEVLSPFFFVLNPPQIVSLEIFGFGL